MRVNLQCVRLGAFNRYAFYPCVLLVICASIFASNNGNANPGNDSRTSNAAEHEATAVRTGPTVKLSYDPDSFEKNSISTFMYFIPLISRSSVERQTSANNSQEVGITSYEETFDEETFQVSCTFEMRGQGFHQATYDPAEMIALRLEEVDGDKPLTHLMNYIKFEGSGFGRIDIRGTIRGSTETVTEVRLRFDAQGGTSPVTIGLYDLRPSNGQYEYENRTKEIVVRVNTLAFKKSTAPPMVEVGIESIAADESKGGILARIRGVIANLLLKPPKIDEVGNDAMLDFGYAIVQREPDFTFPAAKRIKDDSIVTGSAPKP